MDQISGVLTALWRSPSRPKHGLARRDFGEGHWLVIALGEHSLTLATYLLEPSLAQARLVRDLHQDFERANLQALRRGTRSLEGFVFPQRSLVEGNSFE